MELKVFAEAERLKIRRDEDYTQFIPGKDGGRWKYGDGRLAVSLLELTPSKWGFRRNACLRAGMTILQYGDDEGTLLFDPSKPAQVEKVGRIHRKRRVSPEQVEHLRAMSARNRIRKNSSEDRGDTTGKGRGGQGRESEG